VLRHVLARQHLLARGGAAHAGAALPREEEIEDRQIEREIEGLREAILLGDAVALGHHVEEVPHVAVRDHHALGLASRARGEEQVRDVVGRGLGDHERSLVREIHARHEAVRGPARRELGEVVDAGREDHE
jgi:hypothetical protein